MKIKTAVTYSKKIHERLKACDGVVEGYTFSHVFVFGSTIRGKQNPNDLDVLYIGQGKRHKDAAKELSAGMRYANLHHASDVSVDFKVMVEIYPSFNLNIENPGQSIILKRSECGIEFPEEPIGFMKKFPNIRKYMKRLKLSQKTLVHRVLDRYCRLHKITLTGDESLKFLNIIYDRYNFLGVSQYEPPGKLWGSAIRVNFPLSAHEDNFHVEQMIIGKCEPPTPSAMPQVLYEKKPQGST